MIQEFVDRFMAKKEQLQDAFATKHPDDYDAVVKAVVDAVMSDDDYGKHNPRP